MSVKVGGDNANSLSSKSKCFCVRQKWFQQIVASQAELLNKVYLGVHNCHKTKLILCGICKILGADLHFRNLVLIFPVHNFNWIKPQHLLVITLAGKKKTQ